MAWKVQAISGLAICSIEVLQDSLQPYLKGDITAVLRVLHSRAHGPFVSFESILLSFMSFMSTLGVGLGVGVGVTTAAYAANVGLGVGLGVGDGVGLGVGDGVGLGVGLGVGVGVGTGTYTATNMYPVCRLKEAMKTPDIIKQRYDTLSSALVPAYFATGTHHRPEKCITGKERQL